MRSAKRMKRVCALASAMILLTGCARMTVSGGTDAGVACRAFRPIFYSRQDTPESQRQTREHNAVWASLCRK